MPRESTLRRQSPKREGMNSLEALQAAPAKVRAAALALLDEVSAPLTERQVAGAFRANGFGLFEAKRMARALRKLDIIAIARPKP